MRHTVWRCAVICALLLSTTLSIMQGPYVDAHAAVISAAQSVNQDWPTYLHDYARTSASAETILSTSNAALLKKRWAYLTGGGIAASPTIVNGVVYIGSWDGYEYAIDAKAGTLKWKTFLGTTTANCDPATIGITSAAAVANGVVYVGGGDTYWYALDAATGAVLWNVYTGDNSTAGGHYNWSSPLLYNGYAYIGIASNCDNPLVQGQLLQVSLTTHQVVNSVNLVPNGEVGGGVWTSPAIDTATNTIFITTGTQNQLQQPLAQAVVALNASTLAVTSYWQIPFNQRGNDSDWGTSPILFADATGRQLLAAVNKNGILYAFLRSNLSAGPIWQQQIAISGECPPCGDGGISSGAFANGTLYYAAGNTTINGVGYPGSVRAFDPATGHIRWEHGDEQPVFAAIAYDNGLIIDGFGSTLEVLDAASGSRLYTYATGGPIYSAPSIWNGKIYFGSIDNNVYSLTLPGSVPAIPPDPSCPVGWTCQDIRNSTYPGSESIANGIWSVTAAGAGVHGVADQFRLISQAAAGDVQITSQLLTEPTANSNAQAGVIVRQSNNAGSPFYGVMEYANDTPEGISQPTLRIWYRTAFGVTSIQANRINPVALPVYLMIQRVGDVFTAAISTDGVNYTLLSGSRTVVPMPAQVLVGDAVDSGSSTTYVTDNFAQTTIGAPTTQVSQPVTSTPCPATWSCYDVGNPSPVGLQTLSAGQWILNSAGNDIGYYADQFHFVYQTLTGDGEVQAHVTAQGNTSASAKAGVMLRQSLDPGSPYYAIFVTPGNGIEVQYRETQGLRTTQIASIAGTVPIYLKVVRYTDARVSPATTYYTAYTSSDGNLWTMVPWSTVALNMGGSLLAGMAATTHAARVQSTVVMDTVSIDNTATPPATLCPNGWSCDNIGYPDPTGSQTVNNGVWTVQGGGEDIWDVYDEFYYENQPLVGDGTISAHIASQTETDPWAKAGVMLRANSNPDAPYYAALVTPANGLTIQYRTATGAFPQQVSFPGAAPMYIEVARWTDTSTTPATTYLTTYTSTDGVNWSLLSGSTASFSLTGEILAGLAVTSHNTSAASTVTFDSVTLSNTAPVPPNACPTSWTCSDIGGATPTGGQTLTNSAWTIQAGGGDIWGTADSFHYVWQSLAGDGMLSANVTAQTNTDPWAKAGVMVRASADPGAPYYAIFVTPGNGVAVQYRATQGGQTSQVTQAGTTPIYLAVARYTDTSGATPITYLTAYTSSDGANWTPVAGSSVALNLTGVLLAGLAATSHNMGSLSTVAMSAVTLSTSAPSPAQVCPTSWTCSDIGGATPTGGQTLTNSAWTIQAGGGDIWGTADSFHYVWQSLAGDGMLSANVTAQTNTDPWAKAGVMVRASADPGAPYYAIFVTPGNGVAVQYRATQGGQTSQVTQAGTTPIYVQIVRTGSSYSAYTSSDGANWTMVAGSTVSLANLSGSLLAGLATTAHNMGMLSTVVYKSVTIS